MTPLSLPGGTTPLRRGLCLRIADIRCSWKTGWEPTLGVHIELLPDPSDRPEDFR